MLLKGGENVGKKSVALNISVLTSSLQINPFVIFLVVLHKKSNSTLFKRCGNGPKPQVPKYEFPHLLFHLKVSQNKYYFLLVWTYVKFDHWRYKIATLYSARVSDNPLSVKIKLFNQPRMKTVGRKFQLVLHVVIELQLLEINDKDKSFKKTFCPLIKIYVNLSMFKLF